MEGGVQRRGAENAEKRGEKRRPPGRAAFVTPAVRGTDTALREEENFF
jgi:hypothetical protein